MWSGSLTYHVKEPHAETLNPGAHSPVLAYSAVLEFVVCTY